MPLSLISEVRLLPWEKYSEYLGAGPLQPTSCKESGYRQLGQFLKIPCSVRFAKTYESMSDGQLLQTASEGGLVDEAKQTLAEELHRRNPQAR